MQCTVARINNSKRYFVHGQLFHYYSSAGVYVAYTDDIIQ